MSILDIEEKIFLNIYNQWVCVSGNHPILIDRLKKDFSYFLSDQIPNSTKYEVCFEYCDSLPIYRIPKIKSSSQGQNAICYDERDKRYLDYYSEVLSIYNYENEKAEVFGISVERLYEVVYLLILSRTGKGLDLERKHKIHACAVSNKKFSLIIMMPMKGGKSTLFLNLLKNKNWNIISDDSPLIFDNQVLAFPLRVGLEQDSDLVEQYKESIYTIERKLYGKKNLIPLTSLENSIHTYIGQRSILINAVRTRADRPRLIKLSKLKMYKHLLKHMIVGVGLPMIKEYYIRPDFNDWLDNFKIASSRMVTAMKITLKSECYELELCHDSNLNAKLLNDSFNC